MDEETKSLAYSNQITYLINLVPFSWGDQRGFGDWHNRTHHIHEWMIGVYTHIYIYIHINIYTHIYIYRYAYTLFCSFGKFGCGQQVNNDMFYLLKLSEHKVSRPKRCVCSDFLCLLGYHVEWWCYPRVWHGGNDATQGDNGCLTTSTNQANQVKFLAHSATFKLRNDMM